MKKIMIRILTVLLISVYPMLCAAVVPPTDEKAYVLDRAGVLTEQTEEHIRTDAELLQKKTGVEFAVVTVDFLDTAEIEAYAKELLESWELGDRLQNNGLLLLLVTGEDDYCVLPGEGLESLLPRSSLASVLEQDLEEPFAAGEYDSGVCAFFDDTVSLLCEAYAVDFSEPLPEPEPEPTFLLTASLAKKISLICVILVLFFTILTILLGKRKKRRKKRR